MVMIIMLMSILIFIAMPNANGDRHCDCIVMLIHGL